MTIRKDDTETNRSPEVSIVDNRIRPAYKRLRTRRELRRLASGADPVATAVAAALGDVLDERLDPDEALWASRIEALRERLRSSPEEITVTDYGAGSPSLDLSEEEMYRGRVVTRTLAEISKDASTYPLWTLVLFKLVRHLRPKTVLELGTNVGISGSYYSAALELNGGGRLVTLEGADSLAQVATGNLAELGLDRAEVVVGRFQDTLSAAVQQSAPIEHAFIDGLHEKDWTIRFFKEILPFAGADAVLVFDDIAWSDGMREAWQTIRSDDQVRTDIDLGTIGLCIIGRGDSDKRSFDLSSFRAALDGRY